MIIIAFVLKQNIRDHARVVLNEGAKTIMDMKEYDSFLHIPESAWFIAGNLFNYITGIIMAAEIKTTGHSANTFVLSLHS